MKTHTLITTIILIVAFSAQSFAQSFHPTIRLQFAQRLNALLDSIETPHLRVNIQQPDKNNMKFRIDVSNPNGRHAVITIRKKEDIYMSESVSGPVYASLLDFSQMEDGDYQIIVAGGKERVCTNLSIHTETQVNRQVVLH
ncbi:MAG: hypothetical protein J0H07_30980 [Sphingobacteriales bacterium]|nr:hypothetical protein [Sphingobacteriales bacterium]